jgi:hypothetical protein
MNKNGLQVLENCATPHLQDRGEDWIELMELLELPFDVWYSVWLVLQQGRWRKADDPLRYIRKAARRKYRKVEGPERSKDLVGCISELKLPLDDDGMPMNYNDAIDRLYTAPLEWESDECYALQRVHPRFLIPDSRHDDAQCTVDFSKVMDEVALVAGLSKKQQDAIEDVLGILSIAHISREQILSYPEEGERKEYQAALKWLQRNRLLLVETMGRPVDRP